MNYKRNRKGFTMGLVMSVIVLLAILGGGLYQLSASSRIGAIRHAQAIAAKCAADAGLVKAVSDIAYDYEQGTLDLPQQKSASLENCNSDFDFSVYRNAHGDILIESTGSCGPASRTVQCRVNVKSGIFEHALFANKFTVKNNSYIDGYDSDLGSYGGINQCQTSIGTNSTTSGAIKLDNVMDIDGSIVVGPEGDPADIISKGLHVNVTGDMYAAPEEKYTDIIYPPALDYKGTSPSGTITESGKYDELRSINGEVIIIDGDIIMEIDGDFEMSNGSILEIREGSSLQLYVKGTFDVYNKAGINNVTQKPPLCKIFSTSTSPVNYLFNNVSDFYGALYAPNATVNIANNAIIYGSIVADQLNIDNSSEIHGDKALTKGTYGESGTTLVKGKWWE